MTLEFDGHPVQILQCDHHQGVGRGGAIYRTKLKDLKTGAIFDKNFRSGERVPRAHLDRTQMQFLYTDGSNYVFMNNESYEQLELSLEQIGDNAKWVKEGQDVEITTCDGELIGLEVPNSVDREIIQTDPGLRGDTASGGTKPATVEGGAVVQVPLFVEQGTVIRIDTRTGEYVERVSS